MIFKYSISNFLIFLAVMILQIFALNNASFYNVGFMMIYPMVILMMPIRQPIFFVILFAFLTGIILDFFSNTGGLHAASLTLLGFARIFVLNRLEPQADYGKEDAPGFRKFSFRWVLSYFAILILIHHFAFFLIEEISIRHIGEILLKTLVSSFLTLTLILAMNSLIFRR